jgi:ATP synthase assembly factor FMC1
LTRWLAQELLERYNPLFDLTAEERIEATARRVGLNMPVNKHED